MGGEEKGEGSKEVREELGEGSGVVVSPTTPTPATPGDDNPVFSIPRAEVRVRERGGCLATVCLCIFMCMELTSTAGSFLKELVIL